MYPPLNRPRKVLGSRHCIAFLVQEKAKYNVHRIKDNGVYVQVGTIFAE